MNKEKTSLAHCVCAANAFWLSTSSTSTEALAAEVTENWMSKSIVFSTVAASSSVKSLSGIMKSSIPLKYHA